MAVLIRIAVSVVAVASGGCYEPDLRDCTVACTPSEPCAGDQVCNADGLCAAPGITCDGGGGGATVDGGVPGATVTIVLEVNNPGRVVVEGVGECAESECTFQVPLRLLRFDAQPTESDKPFEHWLTPNCGGPINISSSCTFMPLASTKVGAKFK